MKQKPPIPKKAQQQSQLIGYAVLGFGVLALLVVGMMVYARYAPQRVAGTEIADEIHKEGRAPRLTADNIEGDWQASFLDYTARFQARGGTFQVLAVRSFPTAPRYYARGTYTLDGAFMTMTPDNKLGSPADEDPQNRYLHLGHRPFTVEIRFKDDGQLWFIGPVDPVYPRKNPAHPLIQFSDKDYILWTPKK